MATNYLDIVKQLEKFVNEFRNEADRCRTSASEAIKEADKFQERALILENMGETNKAQECRDKQDKCIQKNNSLIKNASEREDLANEWEKLAFLIKNKSSEVLNDIDKLENFLQKGCDENDCPEIRLLIQNRLLQEFTRYQNLLEFCRD